MYVGLDYHKRYSVATVIDQTGKLVEQVKLNNEPQTLRSYVESLPKGSKIALKLRGVGTMFMNSWRVRARISIFPIP